MSLSLEAGVAEKPKARLRPPMATAWRYGISTSGPVATSGAHFLASLLFVRDLPAASFGLFSFVLVIVPFAMSMTASLLVIPVTRALSQAREERAQVVANCLKMNLLLTVLTGLCVFALLLAARAPVLPALLLGLFGGIFTFRWFARCFGFVEGRVHAAIASDIVYAAALICGLGFLAFSHRVTLDDGAMVLLLAALAALIPLGRQFFADQFAALWNGSLRAYGATFRDLTRWSLLGVIFTEMTVNAHAYLVTFIAGPGPFALLALGMLLMRPASLVQSALPDLERPVMTRQIAARDWRALTRTSREFGAGLLAVLLGTLALDAVLLIWFPGLVLKRGYSLHDVMIVATLSALVMAVRCLRAPPAVMLQAAGAFKEMAGLGMKSSAISLLATLALLLCFGPIASLGGVLLGEVVILIYCRKLVTAWEARRD
jgi:O-antigen/teichoic acid export membrane protein